MDYLYSADDYDFWLHASSSGTDAIVSKIASSDSTWCFGDDDTLGDVVSDEVSDEMIDFDLINEDFFS